MNKKVERVLEEKYEEMRDSVIDINPKELSENSTELSEYYLANFDKFMSNAEDLKEKYSYEIVCLTSELVKSDFAFKLMSDFNNIFKKPPAEWSVDERVKLIRDTYESIYQHFILFTLCMSYSEDFMENLRSDWYKPFKAKDKIFKGDDNWYIDGNKCVGKYFILRKSPIFQFFSDDDKELIKNIRNSDSHYKTVIIKDNVILLDEERSTNITESVHRIFLSLLDCYRAAYEFYFNIISFKRYWLPPVLGLTFNKQLDIKNRTVLFDLLDGLVDNKKDKTVGKGDTKTNRRIGALVFTVIYFINIKIWKILIEEKAFLDTVSEKFDKNFSEENIELIRKESIVELINFLRLVSAKVDQFEKGAGKPVFTELSLNDYNDDILIDEVKVFSDRMLEIISSKRKVDGIVFGILSFAMAILTPIRKLRDRFEDLFTEPT